MYSLQSPELKKARLFVCGKSRPTVLYQPSSLPPSDVVEAFLILC